MVGGRQTVGFVGVENLVRSGGGGGSQYTIMSRLRPDTIDRDLLDALTICNSVCDNGESFGGAMSTMWRLSNLAPSPRCAKMVETIART